MSPCGVLFNISSYDNSEGPLGLTTVLEFCRGVVPTRLRGSEPARTSGAPAANAAADDGEGTMKSPKPIPAKIDGESGSIDITGCATAAGVCIIAALRPAPGSLPDDSNELTVVTVGSVLTLTCNGVFILRLAFVGDTPLDSDAVGDGIVAALPTGLAAGSVWRLGVFVFFMSCRPHALQ